jgi:hypothetical protein
LAPSTPSSDNELVSWFLDRVLGATKERLFGNGVEGGEKAQVPVAGKILMFNGRSRWQQLVGIPSTSSRFPSLNQLGFLLDKVWERRTRVALDCINMTGPLSEKQAGGRIK